MSKWQKVLQLDTNRKIVSGSEESLCTAMRQGADIGRINIGKLCQASTTSMQPSFHGSEILAIIRILKYC